MKRRQRIRRKGGRRFKHAHVDPLKREWIRTLRCLVAATDGAFCDGRVECSHDAGAPGERDERKTVPLCVGHHRLGLHSVHVMGRPGFEAFHGVNLDDAAAELDARYERQDETPF